MMIFFIISFVVMLAARILFGAFVDKVNVFLRLLTPLTWLTVIFGILAAVFIAIKIYNEVKKK
ncbi:MAG: hypothetical protein K2G38_00235 [Clostridia bacterium]|nr:hypothetical protein [Clostridia bacterium]